MDCVYLIFQIHAMFDMKWLFAMYIILCIVETSSADNQNKITWKIYLVTYHSE